MARRATVNKTGFANKEGVNHKEAWVCFPCLNCGATVKANIGLSLPTLEEAMGNCVWLCPECGYEHSILSDIPDSMDNFPEEWRSSDDPHCQGFWTAFSECRQKMYFHIGSIVQNVVDYSLYHVLICITTSQVLLLGSL